MAQAGLARITQAGRPGAPTFVLLHGFGGQAAQWLPLMERLAGAGLSTIAFDLPGHAGSLHHAGAGSAKAAAQAVIAGLEDAGPVHLCGHSMGGAVACLAALIAPEKAASLTLLSPGGFGPDINAAALRTYGAAATKAELASALSPFYAPGLAPPEAALERMARMRSIDGQVAMLRDIAGIITTPEGTQGTLPLARIAALGIPASILWGTRDAILPAHQAGALPGGDVRLLDGVGHMLCDEAPETVFAALLKCAGAA